MLCNAQAPTLHAHTSGLSSSRRLPACSRHLFTNRWSLMHGRPSSRIEGSACASACSEGMTRLHMREVEAPLCVADTSSVLLTVPTSSAPCNPTPTHHSHPAGHAAVIDLRAHCSRE